MDKNKEYFQTKSMELENLLKEYKNQYPKNVGALVRNFFPIFIIILSVIAPLLAVFAFVTVSLGLLIMLILVPPILLIFGVSLLLKNKREKKADKTLLPRIEALKQQIEPYTEYPDVKNYLDKFNNQITETDATKKKYRKTFRKILLVFFTIFILVAAGIPALVIVRDSTYGKVKNESANGNMEVLGLETRKPFLSLTPLNKKVYGDCTIASDTVHFFLYDIANISLKFSEIEFENAEHEDVFRLIITDKDGVPVAGCGKFVFKTMIGQATGVDSEYFCPYNETTDEGIKLYANQFKALETCRYLRDHAKDLRFIVDKLN